MFVLSSSDWEFLHWLTGDQDRLKGCSTHFSVTGTLLGRVRPMEIESRCKAVFRLWTVMGAISCKHGIKP